MRKIRTYSTKTIAEDGTVTYTGGQEYTLPDGVNFRIFRDNITLDVESHNLHNPDDLLHHDVIEA